MDEEKPEPMESSPVRPNPSLDPATLDPSSSNTSSDNINPNPTVVSKAKLSPRPKTTHKSQDGSELSSAAIEPDPGFSPEKDCIEPEPNCDKVNVHSNPDHTQSIPAEIKSKTEILERKVDDDEDQKITDETDEDEN